jgi:hypothetical protein
MNIKQKIAVCLVIVSSVVLGTLASPIVLAAECGGAETSIISCPQNNDGTDPKNNGVWGVLLIALNILTAGVGIAAVGGIVYGSILYASAGASAEQTKKAIEIIKNVVIGLVAYGLMYMVLNFVIPGGIFEGP